MMRLNFLLYIGVLIRHVEAFRPSGGLGRTLSIREQTNGARSRGIIFALDDADGDIGRFTEDNTNPVSIPVAPKKKATKRKTKAAVATEAAGPPPPVVDVVVQTPPSPVVAIESETAPAPPATVPSKIYYRAMEDNEMYAVSAISIDSSVVTLKDLKRRLVDANEWSESSRVIFYSGDERLAFTTQLNECLLHNTVESPLSVTVISAVAANIINDVPEIHTEQEVQSLEAQSLETVNNSISLYQAQQVATIPVAPNVDESLVLQNTVNNAALVRNIIAPQPQAPMMPGPKTGRGAVVDMYSDTPTTQTSEWANRTPLDTPQLQQIQQPSYPPPPGRPSVEDTGRFWMNKISLDLGVVLVAKAMKALERSQFLVLAAPGGYGKTSFLQLLERVYEKQGKCVVRFRILQDTDVYHQFQTSSGIDLKNAYIHDLRPNYQKVILIDDAHKVYDTPGFWEVLLKKFPTWCFAWDYTIILAVTLPVPQGSPLIELLGDPTIPHLGPKDFVPDQ